MDEQLYEYLLELSLSPEKRQEFVNKMAELDPVQLKEWHRRQNLEKELAEPYSTKLRCAKGQEDKLCLFEYDSITREFDLQHAWLSMQNFIYDRYRAMKLPAEKVVHINEFLNTLFDHNTSGHIDSIYDVFIKPHVNERFDQQNEGCEVQNNPAFIPKPQIARFALFMDITVANCQIVECDMEDDLSDELLERYRELVHPITKDEMADLLGVKRMFIVHKDKLVPTPAYAQMRNAFNYHSAKLEEHRFMTQLVFGTRPSHEMRIHVHGVFKDMKEIDDYRIRKHSNIHGKAVVAPIGRSALADDFRSNKDGITLYNPSDPEIEIMMNGKHNIRRAEAKVMRKRMSKLQDRTSQETLNKIRKFNQQKERLNKGLKNIREKYSGEDEVKLSMQVEDAKSALDKKINDCLSMCTDSDEVVFPTLKIKGGKLGKGEDFVVKV